MKSALLRAVLTSDFRDPLITEAIEFCETIPWEQLKAMGVERRMETSYFPGQTVVIYPPYPALSQEFNEEQLFRHVGESSDQVGKAYNLYAHVPFCTGICTYCSYARTAASSDSVLIDRYVTSLCKQRDGWLKRLKIDSGQVSTIFLGGGTPTLLSTGQLLSILSGLPRNSTTEVTLETDPDMATRDGATEKLARLREAGVNRVSMGVETFDDTIARQLNRRGHESIYSALDTIRAAGLNNINIDLIYGIPNQSLESWLETLKASVGAGVPSITTYNYKLKPGSIDHKRQSREGSREENPYSFRVVVMQRLAQMFFAKHGYVNNNVNWYTRTNATFKQQGEKYSGSNLLGLGPSTYSFVEGAQFMSDSNLRAYLDAIDNGGSIVERGQILNEDEQAHRRVVFGLKGNFDPAEVLASCSQATANRIHELLTRLERLKLVEYRGERLYLTDSGVLFANELCTLFYSPDVVRRLADSAR